MCVCVQCLCACMLTHVETQSLHQVSFSTVLHFIELTALVGIDSQFAPGLSCLCVLSAEVIDRLLCLPGCMWALEIQTQVLVLVWHAFSPLSHLPSPQVKLFLNYFSKLFIFPISRRDFCKGFHTRMKEWTSSRFPRVTSQLPLLIPENSNPVMNVEL